MKDVNGIAITPGMTVKTTHTTGGLLPPAPPIIGTVEDTVDAFGKPALCIRYVVGNQDRYVLIDHRINEVI